MGTQSAPTPRGPHVIVQDDNVRFYTTFQLDNVVLPPNINDNLESILAHYLFFSEISKPKYKLARECYDSILNRNFLVGENNRQTLAWRSQLVIRLISRKTIVEADDDIHLLEYGQGRVSVRKCVYILYDEGTKLYAPLYVIDQSSNRLLTIFRRDDPIIVKLFNDYVQNVRVAVNPNEQINRKIILRASVYLIDPSLSTTVEPEPSVLNGPSLNQSRKRFKRDDEIIPPR